MIHGSADIEGRRGLHSSLWSHIAALVCITMWGVSFVSSKVLLNNGMGAVEVYVYRFVIAYLVILLFSHKRLWSYSWRDEGLFAICGICSGSIYFIAENTALEYTLVTNVSLLTSLSPLLTAMLAGFMYKNEKPGRGMLLGSSVAFLGVACVIFNSSAGSVSFNPFGDILSIAAAFSWAIYSLVLRRLSANYDVWFVTRKTFFYGLITSLPFLFAQPVRNPLVYLSMGWEVIGNLLFLALGASFIAYVLWSLSIKQLGAVKANNYMYFQSVVTMIFSAIFLGEAITVIGVLGCALIIGGLYIGEKLTARQRMRLGS